MSTSTIHPYRNAIHPHGARRLRVDPAVVAVGLFLAALAAATALVIHFAPSVPADAVYFMT
jgi:Mg/Co/Ni transporter MgtE